MNVLTKALAGLALVLAPAPLLADDHAIERGLANQESRLIEGGGGLPIAITEGGNPDGPALIFLPSLLGSTLNFAKQFDSDLMNTHRIIIMDPRGHGSSAKPYIQSAYQSTELFAQDVHAVIRATGAERPTLVAWAYGGLFAMDYVRHYGDDGISGIVLVEANGGLEAPPKPADTPEYRERIERSRNVNLAVISEWTAGFGAYLMRAEELPQEEAEMVRTSAMMVPHYVRRAFRGRPDDNSDLVSEIDVPVMFLVTITEGPGREMIDRIAGSLANGSVEVIEAGGSLSFWYRPEEFGAALADFAK